MRQRLGGPKKKRGEGSFSQGEEGSQWLLSGLEAAPSPSSKLVHKAPTGPSLNCGQGRGQGGTTATGWDLSGEGGCQSPGKNLTRGIT